MVAVSSRDEILYEGVRDFLNEPFVVVEPVDGEQAAAAAEAYRRFGKGRHPAGLNLGDSTARPRRIVESLRTPGRSSE